MTHLSLKTPHSPNHTQAPPDQFIPAYDILCPQQISAPILFNSPHSGQYVPPYIEPYLQVDAQQLLYSSDLYVDRLIADIPHYNMSVIKHNYLRSYVDINRAPNEIDQALFNIQSLKLTPPQSTERIDNGFGLFATKTHNHHDIYKKQFHEDDIIQRLCHVYWPSHFAVEEYLTTLYQRFGTYLLIDCHSMPSLSFINPDFSQYKQHDIILGNLFDKSCDRIISDYFYNFFREKGLSVAFNLPYAGGYNTSHYSDLSVEKHAIQIELNRACYMDENSLELSDNYQLIKETFNQLANNLSEDYIKILPLY